jgi:uncharacterized membrane protein YdbT with pleckstrin-like domain
MLEDWNQKSALPSGKIGSRIQVERMIYALLLHAWLLSDEQTLARFRPFQLRMAGHS